VRIAASGEEFVSTVPRWAGRRLLWFLLGVCAAVVLSSAFATAPALAAPCTAFASPSGSDTGTGTAAKPYKSVQKLAGSLRAGGTGCLRGGSYGGNVTISRGGSAGAPVALTSYPGERATIAGKLWITDSANFVSVSSLSLDGRNDAGAPSPVVNGDDVTFTEVDVTNYHTGICFDLGATTYGRANRTTIERSRIHDCGRLPATNFDHGIYVEHATSATIVDNQIYDNADRGVQLYPDAQGTYVARNVIDGNGEGVVIAGGSEDYGLQASNDNLIERNLITFSTQRNNVESHWDPSLVGQRNVVRGNCIYGGALDGKNHGLAPDNGFVSSGNLGADPGYVNRAAKDFRLRASSPCAGVTGAPAVAATASRAGKRRIVVTSSARSARLGGAVVLRGRVEGGTPPRCITLKIRRKRKWVRIARSRVGRDGSFSTTLRLKRGRKARSRRGCARHQRVAMPRSAKSMTLSASAPGFARSNSVRLRVRRR
jgi:hypothetical protein